MSYLKGGGGGPGTGGVIPHDQVGLGKHHVRNGQDRTMGTPGAVKKLLFQQHRGGDCFFSETRTGAWCATFVPNKLGGSQMSRASNSWPILRLWGWQPQVSPLSLIEYVSDITSPTVLFFATHPGGVS